MKVIKVIRVTAVLRGHRESKGPRGHSDRRARDCRALQGHRERQVSVGGLPLLLGPISLI